MNAIENLIIDFEAELKANRQDCQYIINVVEAAYELDKCIPKNKIKRIIYNTPSLRDACLYVLALLEELK